MDADRSASAGCKAERLFVQKWSDSDSHKKACGFAGPLDAIVMPFCQPLTCFQQFFTNYLSQGLFKLAVVCFYVLP